MTHLSRAVEVEAPAGSDLEDQPHLLSIDVGDHPMAPTHASQAGELLAIADMELLPHVLKLE